MNADSAPVRIAVTSRSFSRHKVLRQELAAIYSNVTFNDAGSSLAGDALVAFLSGHDRAIVALEKIDEAVLVRLPQLRVISKYGVGLDNIDVEALRRHRRSLGWKGGVNRRSVAELALSFMIALLHNVPAATSAVRGGAWQQIMGRQLTGKTVGIVGCGHVGKDLVGLLKPFGVRILAYDIVRYDDFYRAHEVEAVDLEPLLAASDVVTLHVPCDESSRNILNADRLAKMKPGAVLVNTARGGLVDEVALGARLSSGHLAGAALDVFETEPPGQHALLAMHNVLATPHIGGSAEEAILAMGRAAILGLEENSVP